MTKSGAVLAWEYFHPNLPVPELFKYVQDRDLWRWEFGRATKYVGAYLYAGPLTIESYGLTMNEMERDSTKIFITGKILQEAQEANVELMIAKSFLTQVDIYTVPVVNTLLLQSEVCERLLELHPEAPFAAAFYQIGDIERWSLRSRGSFDVSTVGEKFKGGGHKGAAGFVRPAMNRVWDV
jgi:oligoribonuclease NrnB/cAMP/cGMP phosphodiesterase (DHH superfamily)